MLLISIRLLGTEETVVLNTAADMTVLAGVINSIHVQIAELILSVKKSRMISVCMI